MRLAISNGKYCYRGTHGSLLRYHNFDETKHPGTNHDTFVDSFGFCIFGSDMVRIVAWSSWHIIHKRYKQGTFGLCESIEKSHCHRAKKLGFFRCTGNFFSISICIERRNRCHFSIVSWSIVYCIDRENQWSERVFWLPLVYILCSEATTDFPSETLGLLPGVVDEILFTGRKTSSVPLSSSHPFDKIISRKALFQHFRVTQKFMLLLL